MTAPQTTLPEKNADLAALRGEVMTTLALLDDFGTLLDTETAALRLRDFEAVDRLQEQKRDLARRYHAAVTCLAAQSGALPAIEMPLREKLIRARTEFTGRLQENLTVLESVRKSAQRLVDKILDTARASVTAENQHAYAASGKAQAARSTSLSLSLDQSL